MTRIIVDLFILLAVCIIGSVFYWHVCWPVILKRIRFHLFEVRDNVRAIAAERGLANDFAFKQIERFICRTIAIAPFINLRSFAWFVAHKGKNIDTSDYDRFSREAPAELKGMRDVTVRCAISVMMLNSPWEVFLFLFLLPILWSFGRLSHLRIYQGTEEFVDDIELESPHGANAAC
jgi:hypothetical protein